MTLFKGHTSKYHYETLWNYLPRHLLWDQATTTRNTGAHPHKNPECMPPVQSRQSHAILGRLVAVSPFPFFLLALLGLHVSNIWLCIMRNWHVFTSFWSLNFDLLLHSKFKNRLFKHSFYRVDTVYWVCLCRKTHGLGRAHQVAMCLRAFTN